MSWKRLDINDMRRYLSEDEILTLDNISKSSDITDMINSQIDDVVDAFRGAWVSKGYTIDIRDHYAASEYVMFIMEIARQKTWERFPMSPSIGLDDARRDSYKNALELLKNPYIGTSKPDWEYSPENPVNGGMGGGSIKFPFLRMDASLYDGWYNGSPLTTKAYCR